MRIEVVNPPICGPHILEMISDGDSNGLNDCGFLPKICKCELASHNVGTLR